MTEAVQDAYATLDFPDTEAKTGKRSIAISEPTDGQLTQIVRASSAISRAGDNAEAVKYAVARAADVLLALITVKEERFWVDEGLTEGRLRLADLTPIMEALAEAQGEDAPAAPKTGPVKRTRAARGSR